MLHLMKLHSPLDVSRCTICSLWNTSKVSLHCARLWFVTLGHRSCICPYQRRHTGRILQTGRERRPESVSLWQLRLTLVGPSPKGVCSMYMWLYCVCECVLSVLKCKKVEKQSMKFVCIFHRLCPWSTFVFWTFHWSTVCYVSRNRNRESVS